MRLSHLLLSMGTKKGIPYSFPFQCPWFPFKAALKGKQEKASYGSFSFVIVPKRRPGNFPIFLFKSILKGKIAWAPTLKTALKGTKKKHFPIIPCTSPILSLLKRPFKKG